MCLGTMDSVSAWNHAEDIVAVSPLITYVCINNYYYENDITYVSQTIVVSLLAIRFFGDWLDRGGGLVQPKGENSIATSGL